MEKVLVTGGDGFLGNNIVRVLLQEQFLVKVFVHPDRDLTILEGLEIEVYKGDLLDEKAVINAAEGCDYIIHAAANTSIWPNRSLLIRQVNYQGTLNVLGAVKANKVKRLVAIGSATSFGAGTADKPGDELSEFTAGRFGLDYIDSKKMAQDAILEAVKTNDLDAVILNPTFMLGPYDNKPSSGELILSLYFGKLPGYTNGGRNFIHVRDVAIAATKALSLGNPGECYLMANKNMTYREFNSLVAEVAGIQAPKIFVPGVLILSYGWLSEVVARLFGQQPKLSLAIARISLITNYYTAKKAVNVLKMPQTPVREAIKEAFDWFRENGYLENN